MGANRLEDMYRLSRIIASSKHFGEHNDENMLAQDILDAGYDSVEQVRKKTARDILCKWWIENIAINNEIENDYVEELVCDYGLDYDEFRKCVEVDE